MNLIYLLKKKKKNSIDLKSFQTQPKVVPYHDTTIQVNI